MFYTIPPVGSLICLDRQHPDISPDQLFGPYRVFYLASGTMALAVAIRMACDLAGVSSPEVILPAYGCPDLVSAANYAGARPVLADLEHERPWMNLEQVRSMISPSTVAIIAAGFLGIPERMDALGEIAQDAGITLIEDSAQAFPAGNGGSGWSGDLVVLSFGRGKPVSLLGGGALLYKDQGFESLLPDIDRERAGLFHDVSFRLYAALYNRLISPRIFWMLEQMPFLHFGETRYQPLETLRAMDDARLAVLPVNARNYLSRGRWREVAVHQKVVQAAGTDEQVIDLPAVCCQPGKHHLLRYPLLVDAGRRSTVIDCLSRKHLGASVMYPAILPELPGIPAGLADPAAFPAARDFASRLITLPVHEQVREKDISMAASCLPGPEK
jgi:dTDP-4-amino-4,6-dideoxygalactose transaminase